MVNLRLHLSVSGVKFPSLVRELRSHRRCGQKNQNITKKQHCNKFNKDFENSTHQEKKSFVEKKKEEIIKAPLPPSSSWKPFSQRQRQVNPNV